MKILKEIRKKIEAELIVSLTGLFKNHNAGLTRDLLKPIKTHSYQLAKKYVKILKAKEKAVKKAAKKKLVKLKAAPLVVKKAVLKTRGAKKRTVRRK